MSLDFFPPEAGQPLAEKKSFAKQGGTNDHWPGKTTHADLIHANDVPVTAAEQFAL